MSYEAAKEKAWAELFKLGLSGKEEIRFFGESFQADPDTRSVVSLLNLQPAKDFESVIILHYLAARLKGLPHLTGEWLTFRELSGVEGYTEAFQRRVISPLVNKFGDEPQKVSLCLSRLPGKKYDGPEAGVIVEPLAGVPSLMKVWAKDAEFEASANLYFDRSILKVFCTEDIVVLAGFVASRL